MHELQSQAITGPEDSILDEERIPTFRATWDDEGVYFYQAYRDEIADWAIENQTLGGPLFSTTRMTWVKPSFGWVLYRSGYGTKHNQTRILKIKVSHRAVSEILESCVCKLRGGGSNGRVQWDPERDMYEPDPKQKNTPRKMLRRRAIQIGVKGHVLESYIAGILSIEDVTDLSRQIGALHAQMQNKGLHKNKSKSKSKCVINPTLAMQDLTLPEESPYMPHCSDKTLEQIGLVPGSVALKVAALGLGYTQSPHNEGVEASQNSGILNCYRSKIESKYNHTKPGQRIISIASSDGRLSTAY